MELIRWARKFECVITEINCSKKNIDYYHLSGRNFCHFSIQPELLINFLKNNKVGIMRFLKDNVGQNRLCHHFRPPLHIFIIKEAVFII